MWRIYPIGLYRCIVELSFISLKWMMSIWTQKRSKGSCHLTNPIILTDPTHCREEINQILSKCDTRQDLKSLSCLWPQQIRIDGLPGLRIGDTKKIDWKINLYMIWVYAKFNPDVYIFHLMHSKMCCGHWRITRLSQKVWRATKEMISPR